MRADISNRTLRRFFCVYSLRIPGLKPGFLFMDYQYLIDQVKRHEGLRLKPYKCTAGKLTIGYGRNLENVGISEAEAEALLLADLAKFERCLTDFRWYQKLNNERQTVLINMAFNLGIAGLLKFKNMIAAIEAENFETASVEMLDSQWAKQVGRRAQELAEMMETGEYL